MSKWLNKDKFKEFANKKAVEAPRETGGDFVLKWKNPVMGTQDKAKEYRVRFLPDKDSNFYMKYCYHYFVIDEKHYFIFCPKTHSMDEYCPWCSVSQMLYKGNKEDKKLASNYKRMEKFVGNVLVVDDPRDADVEDEYKVSGKVRLYEFPGTIESKLKNEITDRSEGYGMAIFDPEEGFDLIIKIKAKKPDKNGKVWPDYSDTQFSRKPSSIGTEKEIEELIAQTVNLQEFIEKESLSWDEHKKLLKLEGYWEDIEDEFNRRTGTVVSDKKPEPNENTTDENTTESSKKNLDQSKDKDSEEPVEIKPSTTDEMSEEELLRELQNM